MIGRCECDQIRSIFTRLIIRDIYNCFELHVQLSDVYNCFELRVQLSDVSNSKDNNPARTRIELLAVISSTTEIVAPLVGRIIATVLPSGRLAIFSPLSPDEQPICRELTS